MSSSLHLPSDHDRYVVPVRYSVSAPPCAQLWRCARPRTTGTPRCLLPHPGCQLSVAARPRPRRRPPVARCAAGENVCVAMSSRPTPGLTGCPQGRVGDGTRFAPVRPPRGSPAPRSRPGALPSRPGGSVPRPPGLLSSSLAQTDNVVYSRGPWGSFRQSLAAR